MGYIISKGMAKPKNGELKLLNNYFEDVRGRLFNHYRELKIEGVVLTAEAVKNAYMGIEPDDHVLQRCLLPYPVLYLNNSSG